MQRKIIGLVLCILIIFVCSCKGKNKGPSLKELNPVNDNYYQILVRSFSDSDGDGIGDFNGIKAKLPYLKDLGVTALWLMPINPSPTYHGYDVLDYYNVNSEYGTLDDFRSLCKEASNNGIKIMIDLVINHTSNKHPWFIKALQNDPVYKDYYVFYNKPTNGLVGSWGQNIWHTVNGKKYCGYFSDTMPDLNYENKAVQQEMIDIGLFWVEQGVKGFRIDAAQHLFGTNEYIGLKNSYMLDLNVMFLNKFTSAMKEKASDAFVIGEINTPTESIVKEYFRGLDSPLDFPVASTIMRAASSAASTTYVNNIKSIYNKYSQIKPDFVSTPFLRNHDEDRLASEFSGDINKMRLACEMLLTLPGSPIIYYGEELGMFGTKSNGEVSGGIGIYDETRRLPLPFGDKYQTTWFKDTSFKDVVLNKNIPSAIEQINDPSSLYNIYKNILNVRNNHMALKYGNTIESYSGNTNYIQGYTRSYTYNDKTETVLIIHNISLNDKPFGPIDGTLIYSSINTSSDIASNMIKGKSTLIFDISGK